MAYRASYRSKVIVLVAVLEGFASEALCGAALASTVGRDLEEVIVSARKRDENILEVPISVSAFDGALLEQTGVAQLADFLKSAPGVAIADQQSGTQEISIRGISSFFGDAPVGFYLDEVSFSFVGSTAVPDVRTFDLERVEVLRGPQGTLFGDGSLGGVVRVLTRKADLNDFDAKVELTTSQSEDADDANTSLKGVLNLPLIEGKAALRIVGSSEEYAGWVDQTDPLGLTIVEKDVNARETDTFRAKLRLAPIERLDIELGVWRQKDSGGGATAGEDNRTLTFTPQTINSQSYDTYTMTTAFDAGAVSIVNAAAIMNLETAARGEIFGLPAFFSTEEDLKQNELRFQSNADGRLRWTGGAYYRELERRSAAEIPAFALSSRQLATSEAWAVFGEATWLMTPRVDATVGLRYFEDERMRHDQPDLIGKRAQTFNTLSPRVNLTYRIAERWIVYGNVTKGFRSGQIQPLVALVASGFTAPIGIHEESLWSYEVGTKGRLFDDRVVVESALYLNDWRDLQLNQLLSPTVAVLLNGGNGRTSGIEMSVSYRPLDSLTLSASASLLDAEFTSDGPPGVPISKGDPISGAPQRTFTVSMTYARPLTAELDGHVRLGAQYTSERVDLINGVAPSDALTQVDARVGVSGAHWDLSFFGSNLTNEDGAVTPAPGFGFGEALHLRPRTVGVSLTVNLEKKR